MIPRAVPHDAKRNQSRVHLTIQTVCFLNIDVFNVLKINEYWNLVERIVFFATCEIDHQSLTVYFTS